MHRASFFWLSRVSGLTPLACIPIRHRLSRSAPLQKMRQNPSLLLPVLGPLVSATAVLRQNVVPALLPRQAGGGVCQATQPTVAAPHANIWAGLTNQEMADALEFLYKSKELNLTQDGGR